MRDSAQADPRAIPPVARRDTCDAHRAAPRSLRRRRCARRAASMPAHRDTDGHRACTPWPGRQRRAACTAASMRRTVRPLEVAACVRSRHDRPPRDVRGIARDGRSARTSHPIIVGDFVIVPGHEPGTMGMGSLQIGVAAIERVAIAVVLQRECLRRVVAANQISTPALCGACAWILKQPKAPCLERLPTNGHAVHVAGLEGVQTTRAATPRSGQAGRRAWRGSSRTQCRRPRRRRTRAPRYRR